MPSRSEPWSKTYNDEYGEHTRTAILEISDEGTVVCSYDTLTDFLVEAGWQRADPE